MTYHILYHFAISVNVFLFVKNILIVNGNQLFIIFIINIFSFLVARLVIILMMFLVISKFLFLMSSIHIYFPFSQKCLSL